MKLQRYFYFLSLGLILAAPACRHTHFIEPEIRGSLRFRNQVFQAMFILKTQAPEAYAVVTNYVRVIKEGERSGMWADKNPPTYEMSDVTAYYSVTWCAATIAHDSFHSKLYHDYRNAHGGSVPDSVWIGTNAEQQCMKHQLLVMQQIGAPKWEMDHAKNLADGHYVKDQETWQDYKKRKW